MFEKGAQNGPKSNFEFSTVAQPRCGAVGASGVGHVAKCYPYPQTKFHFPRSIRWSGRNYKARCDTAYFSHIGELGSPPVKNRLLEYRTL